MLNSHDISKLHRIIGLAEKLIAKGSEHSSSKGNGAPKAGRRAGRRIRRTGKELIEFRKMLKAERKKGVPVVKLAQKHGVSSAYIYMLP